MSWMFQNFELQCAVLTKGVPCSALARSEDGILVFGILSMYSFRHVKARPQLLLTYVSEFGTSAVSEYRPSSIEA